MGKVIKRIGKVLALSYLCYFFSGMAYNFLASRPSVFEGKYNTDKVKAKKSVKQKVGSLEELIKTLPNNKKANIYLELYIDTEVKRFYDDLNDKTDDDKWSKEILRALKGLNLYEKEGLHFVIDKVNVTSLDYYFGVNMEENSSGVDSIITKQFINYSDVWYASTKERFKLFLLPPINKELLGFAKPVEGYAVVFMTNSEKWNESTTAHEIGHLLGLRHPLPTLWLELSCLLDPFNILIARDVMLQGIWKQSYKLSDEEKKVVKAIKNDLIYRREMLNH